MADSWVVGRVGRQLVGRACGQTVGRVGRQLGGRACGQTVGW